MKRRGSIFAFALILVLALVGLVACDISADTTEYAITVAEASNGTVTASHEKAVAGTSITLTVTANDGYILSALTVDGEAVTVADGTATFTMPSHDVTVAATFGKEGVEPIPAGAHGITVSAAVGGSVKASASSAKADEVISLTVTPSFGYELSELKVNDSVITAVDGAYSFTMPDADVTVSATFVLASNTVTAAAPEGAIELSSAATLGGTANAAFVASYEASSIKLVAYVADAAITANDGIAVYLGSTAYASGKLTSANKGVKVMADGTVTVLAVQDGAYAAVEATLDASVAPWAADGAVKGYVVEISAAYELLGATKADLEGNVTVLFALTNCDKSNYANTACYDDGNIDNADTYCVLGAEGSLSENYYKFGAGQLGQGNTPIATGRYWDLSLDYASDSENYADRKVVLNGHDDADNNLAFFRVSGQNMYATATFTLTGMGNAKEAYGKFGLMLFNGASQKGLFFYVDALIGWEGGTINDISGTSLGYNYASNGWGSWTSINDTNGSYNTTTKSVTLGLTVYDGMVYMYLGDTLVAEMGADLGDDATIGFKSFGYNMEVTNYYATDDVNDAQFIAHRKEIVNKPVDALFLGDSYMEFWNSWGFETHTAAIDSDKKADIGVSGTQINYWTDKIGFVKKLYTPSKLVFHIGVNDIDDGNTTAETAFARLQTMYNTYHEAFPDADIYWVSLVHNTMFANKCDEYDKMNALVKEWAESEDKLHYIDVTAAFVDENGNTRANMFCDGLHFNYEYGYPLWGKLIMQALGYTERAQGTTLGDIEGKYAYNNWTFDGEVAQTTANGEQTIYVKDMQAATDFIVSVDVYSPQKNNSGDVWTKVGLMLRNDNYTIMGYHELGDSIAQNERVFCNLVYRSNSTSGTIKPNDWDWGATGVGGNASKLVESGYVTIGIAKVGNTVYMLVEGQIVATHSSIGDISSQAFVAGIIGFNRDIYAKNAQVVTGTQDELLIKLGLKAADATLDGVANEAIWTDEVLGNAITGLGKRSEGSYYDLAAVKGTDGVYFLATVYHKQALTDRAQGNNNDWYNWLNIEYRFGNATGSQAALYFENGVLKAFGGIVVGDYVTTAPEEEGGLNKTVVEFWVPYKYFSGYTAESDEILVHLWGWVAETGWTSIFTTPTVSTHGVRYEHEISVNGNATVDVAKTARKGDTIEFTVSVVEGLTIESVKIGENTLTVGENGKYSFVMPDSNVTIVVAIDGRRNVDLSAVAGKVQIVGDPDQGSTIEIVGVAPWTITKLMINGSEVEKTDDKYQYLVGTDDLVVTADFVVVTDGITIDGTLETELYGTTFTAAVNGGRNMTITSKITSHGIVIYTTAITNTNPSGQSDFWENLNFEFYVNNTRFAVNNNGQSPVNVGVDKDVDSYFYGNTVVDGKYHHVIELYISKDTLGSAWNAERMQINYAWCVANEIAHVLDNINTRYDASHWWGQAAIGGCSDGDWAWGSGWSRPANLFATTSGLITTKVTTAADETIDGIASEKYGEASLTVGDAAKAQVTVQGYVGSDGLYFLFTIKHHGKSTTDNAWYLNDNIEFVLDSAESTNGTWTPFSIIEGQLRVSGLIGASSLTVSGEDGDYTSVVEIFVPIANPDTSYKARFGIAGTGFGGWQAAYWDNNFFGVSADGVYNS